MGHVDQKKNNHTNGDTLSRKMPIEGTAARTRPFSFEEVMLRRKNRVIVADVKVGASEPRENHKTNDTGSGFSHVIQKFGMNMKDKGKEGYRKAEDRKIEDITTKREENHSKGINKGKNDLDDDNEEKHRNHKSSNEKHSKSGARNHHKGRTEDMFKDESKSGTRNHHKSRTDDRLKDESDRGSRKKRSEDMTTKDKDMEDDRDPERKKRKLRHTLNDLKIRSELVRSDFNKEFEYSERGWRYEGSRTKTQRSRSREHYHKREKSISLSPRSCKRTNHQESSHFRGRSGRQYSDSDKYRASWNVGYENRHYRRHGGGLGGYSPRKRRIKSTAKSPSSLIHSPERKVMTWDQRPGDSLPSNIQSALSSKDNLPSSNRITKDVSKVQAVPSDNTTATLSSTSADTIQLTQATRPMRRLYIENLPPSASDKAMIDWLNGALSNSFGKGSLGTPCISCMINKEKSQAVVEFLTPEGATAALSYSGKSFCGSVLKIRRPKDFIDMTSGARDKQSVVTEATHANHESQVNNSNDSCRVEHTISDVVKDSPHKLFIGGISKSISANMLMEIVSVFGPLKAYHFEINGELNQPCAFLEYLDQSVTVYALTGLNGMKIGGQILTVVRGLSSDHFDEDNEECISTYTIPEHARPLLENPTQVLKLTNVFNHEDFPQLAQSELEETLEDIRLECTRFGSVKSINVVRYLSSSSANHDISEQNTSMQKDSETRGGTSTTDSMQHSGAISQYGHPHIEDDTHGKPYSNDENSMNHETNTSEIDNHEQSLQSHVTEGVDAEANEKSELCLQNSTSVKESNQEVENIASKVRGEEKADAKIEDGNSQTCHINLFEPMTVLVEFLREESTLMAAHCLNGRLFGEQVVAAGYASYDAYCTQFQR